MALIVPDGFRFDIMAAEMSAALKTVVIHKGFPAFVNMEGVPERGQAYQLRDELIRKIEVIERSWNQTQRVKFSVVVREGKTKARGFDVSLRVDIGQDKVVAPTPAS